MKNKLKFSFLPDYKVRITLCLILIFLLLSALTRLALLLLYPSVFTNISAGAKVLTFIFGLKFDLSIFAVFLGAPIFFFNLPIKSAWWNKLWLGLIAFLFFAFVIYNYSDLLYFPQVHRHISDELLHISNDWGFILNYVVMPLNLLFLIITLGLSVLLYWISTKYYKKHSDFKRPILNDIIKLFFIIALTICFIRGKFTGKPIGIADIYSSAHNPTEASLVANPMFIGFHIIRKGKPDLPPNNYPFDKAVKNTQDILIKTDEITPDSLYPLMRRAKDTPTKKELNFVIVMFEGWMPEYIDAISGKNRGATPVFDQIIKEGVLFTNAYATGLRSLFGFASIFASIPLVPGLPVFGYGLELAKISPPFEYFAKEGYYTFYAQTSPSHSYRMCPLASYLGADESYGWEDIPMVLDYQEEAPYGYDYELYMFAADKIKNRETPNFMGALFTGITHEPFTKTQDRFYKYKGGSWPDEYSNTLYYADWSLGQFLQKAKEDGWFEDTVFIFVSDHNLRSDSKSLYEKFNIPLVFYAPKHLKPAKIDYIVSQLDILPTIYNMAGLDYPYTAFGRDMFDKTAPEKRVAFVSEGLSIGLISDSGAIRHSRGAVLSTEPRKQDFDEKKAEDILLSLDKTVFNLITSNKWFKNGK